jgi:hypothetical protein
MTCVSDWHEAQTCEEHVHCVTCGFLLDDAAPPPPPEDPRVLVLATCRDCELPLYPVDDVMDPVQRQVWEFELRHHRGGAR